MRDPNGVLKEASWEEKQRMCQIYFPIPGRKIKTPKMFEDEHLQVSPHLTNSFKCYDKRLFLLYRAVYQEEIMSLC